MAGSSCCTHMPRPHSCAWPATAVRCPCRLHAASTRVCVPQHRHRCVCHTTGVPRLAVLWLEPRLRKAISICGPPLPVRCGKHSEAHSSSAGRDTLALMSKGELLRDSCQGVAILNTDRGGHTDAGSLLQPAHASICPTHLSLAYLFSTSGFTCLCDLSRSPIASVEPA